MAIFEIKMPKLGESITEGIIISWSVKVGDTVHEDDVLFEVNTAKVSAEIPSPVAGKITEIRFKEGDTVAVGTVVAVVELEEEGEQEGQPEPAPDPEAAGEEKKKEKSEEQSETQTTPPPAEERSPEDDNARWYSPVILLKAKEARISKEELDSIPGTGYLDRLTKWDLETYLDNKKAGTSAQPSEAKPEEAKPEEEEKAKTSVSDNEEAIPMDVVRRIIADRMTASKKTSAHVTSVIEADVTRLVKWREENKEAFLKQEGVPLTYMSPVTEAVANALRQYPRVNSSVDGYTIIRKKQINIGIAVSLSDGNLIVPVIKNADKLNVNGLAAAIATLAGKARNHKLTPDDIQGGTFSITNFGSFNSLFGTPIINQPEVAILGVGVIEKKPAVINTPEGDAIAIRHKMYLSLSYDHRIIDGALAGNFLKHVADYLENHPK